MHLHLIVVMIISSIRVYRLYQESDTECFIECLFRVSHVRSNLTASCFCWFQVIINSSSLIRDFTKTTSPLVIILTLQIHLPEFTATSCSAYISGNNVHSVAFSQSTLGEGIVPVP
mgnify:CR=1 FL=1